MELVSLIAAFCLPVSFMLASCASDQVNVPKSAHQYGNYAVHQAQIPLPLLPRKFRIQEEANVKTSADKDIMLQKMLLESSSGNREIEREENVENHAHAARKAGTWREWVENPNKSEYFTMDYAWVRRRRPIHNKQIPFAP